MKEKLTQKKVCRLAFALTLSALVTAFAIGFLAHNVRSTSFNPSQIYELTGNEKGSAEISGKIEKELSELFRRKSKN